MLVLIAAAFGAAAAYEVDEIFDLRYYGDGPISDEWGNLVALDLYRPIPVAAAPLFVFIHGGAWRSGDKLDYRDLCRSFVETGEIACASVNYRLSAGDNPVMHPNHTADGAAAVRYLIESAPLFGYNGDAIVVGGHSAGGHMSGMLLLDDAFGAPRVQGYVGIQGIFDIPIFVADFPDTADDFINDAFSPDPAAWADASPTRKSPADGSAAGVPFLVVHAPTDQLVNVPQAEAMVAHLAGLGAAVEYETEIRGSHFGVLSNPLLVEIVLKFVARAVASP